MKLPVFAGIGLLAASCASAQDNAAQAPAPSAMPFAVKSVATFKYPWRIAFLPDGRMLVTEKPGRLFLVTQAGDKRELAGVPKVVYEGQQGLLDVVLSPTFATDKSIYLTYAEPGEGGSGLALARARLEEDGLKDLRVLWRQVPFGKGGQLGGIVTFDPTGAYLFLAVGERQRFTPAQDPNQATGKILRLTLDGKPAPGNPMTGKTGASTVTVTDPPRNTEIAKTTKGRTATLPGPNLTPSETWTTGHRNPLGMAFDANGTLWEIEMGPRGGDELNRIEPGANYGWPLVSNGINYDGVPIPKHETRPDFAKPAISWTPVISPGGLAFYEASLFSGWKGSAFAAGLSSKALIRISFDGKGGAFEAERWEMGARIRDVEVAPDGAIWVIEDKASGRLLRLAPK
ncbi:PQQ-dependent sugar dehydrogenase [Sphingobium sp. DEHP117]|uniref:PQQ-dependent sugar dehydrogenase n=1 Tax=Sphingobium sp. DEHP117 TaxID=2993436 RepID=UPI0027D607D6|nr:PQQ-dependent sugar dehydrogenase [Sphingobium sp. DEHP117]MDQ4419457.1 PQQ-dependent sugar dehydrogenase [Sphingobium sp. DEHP117]